MKKLLLAFTSLAVLSASAQEFPYDLTTFTEAYQPLSEAISVTPGDDSEWDDPEFGYYIIPLGFTFDLMGRSSDQIAVIDPGCQVVVGIQQDTVNVLSPYFADVRNADDDTVVSSILYTTEGPVGQRIFKLEWSNIGFFNEYDATGEFHSVNNYQVWFYETTNDIEFRFGPNTITDGTLIHQEFGSPLLFFIRDFDIATQSPGDTWNLRGAPEDPIVGTIDLYSQPDLDEILMGEPMDSIVYHFDTGIIGVYENTSADKFSLFPTVADQQVATYWSGHEKMQLRIFDMTGNLVLTSTVSNGNNVLDISSLASGTYVVQVNDATRNFTRKIIKR